MLVGAAGSTVERPNHRTACTCTSAATTSPDRIAVTWRGGDTGWLRRALRTTRGGRVGDVHGSPTVLAAVQTEWGLSNAPPAPSAPASQAGTAPRSGVFRCGRLLDPRAVFLVSSAVAAAVALLLPVLAAGPGVRLPLFFVMAVVAAGSYTPGVMLIAGRFEPGAGAERGGWFLASSSVAMSWRSRWAAGWWRRPGGAPPLWALALGSALPPRRLDRAVPGDRRPRAAPSPRAALQPGHRARAANRAGQFMAAGCVFHSWELLGMWAWTPAFMAAACPRRPRCHAGALGGAGGGACRALPRDGHRGGSTGGWLSDRWGRTAIAWMMAVEHAVLVQLRLDARDAVARGGAAGLPLRLCRARRFRRCTRPALTETVPSAPAGPRRWPSASLLGFGAWGASRRGCSAGCSIRSAGANPPRRPGGGLAPCWASAARSECSVTIHSGCGACPRRRRLAEDGGEPGTRSHPRHRRRAQDPAQPAAGRPAPPASSSAAGELAARPHHPDVPGAGATSSATSSSPASPPHQGHRSLDPPPPRRNRRALLVRGFTPPALRQRAAGWSARWRPARRGPRHSLAAAQLRRRSSSRSRREERRSR